jgi:glycosyltransferase involved in cell wall biosynthesis
MQRKKQLSVAVWCPSYKNSTGGIQQYSRLLVSTLQTSHAVQSCRVLPLSPGKAQRFFFSALALWQLLRFPDLVIITHLHLARLSFLLRVFRIPYWVCLHGIECWHPLSQQDLKSLSHASQLLCVSRYTRQKLMAHHPTAQLNTVLFPNHIEAPTAPTSSQTEARLRLGLENHSTDFIFLTVSRLASQEQYKGHRQMLHAMSRLKEQGQAVHYLIIGEGDDQPALLQLRDQLHLQKEVTFLGRADDKTLHLAYSACDAFAMPSTGEGFGIVFLEALAHGRPVLAGNQDGSVDALRDGALGLLINPLDETSLIMGLRQLQEIAKQSSAQDLIQAVLNEFGPEKQQERLDQLLENQLNSCAA